MSVSSEYLKNAMKTQMRKRGNATTKAVPFGVPLLVSVFRTAKVSHNPIARMKSCTIEIVAGHTLIHILNQLPEIFLGMKIFIIWGVLFSNIVNDSRIPFKYICESRVSQILKF